MSENQSNIEDMYRDVYERVYERQATINIGTIGHVAHGKSTLVKAISGVKTVRFKSELIRNITIKLGYANAKIYKCNDSSCQKPGNYKSTGSDVFEVQLCHCGSTMTLQRHISFVDCPGHGVLMSTMLNGTSVMDAAFLLIASNEEFPQPQTLEHIAAIEITNLKNLIIVQNKVDLVKETDALIQYEKVKEFMKDTKNQDSPIIPVSAQLNYNIDVLCDYIVNRIPIPKRDLTSTPRMSIIRSFDVNKPGRDIDSLKGGICGGSITRGVFRLGDEIEIRPGIVDIDNKGKMKYMPIFSRIVSLFAENNNLEFAIPGGLIGIGTNIDPILTKGDHLVGQMLGNRGTLPEVYTEIEISFFLLRKIVGSASEKKTGKIEKGEHLMINSGSMTTGGKVIAIKNDMAKISLINKPLCLEIGDKIALSRRIDKHFRLIGYGKVINGLLCEKCDKI